MPFYRGPRGGLLVRNRRSGAADPAAFYLHELSLSAATQFGTLVPSAASMKHNGIEVVMPTGVGVTVDSMEAGVVGWSWPVSLVRDIAGDALAAPLNLAQYPTELALLERSPTEAALPNTCWALFGFCEGADPSDSVGQGIAAGLAWPSTTVRGTIGSSRRTDTTWTPVKGATPTSTCFGARLLVQSNATTGQIGSRVTPLDAAYGLHSGTGNIAVVHTANVSVDLMSHMFIAFGRVAQTADTPTIRVDGYLVRPQIPRA